MDGENANAGFHLIDMCVQRCNEARHQSGCANVTT